MATGEIDLGCAYTLEVDDAGGGLLHVTSGWVALQLKDRESIVPAGAACATRPGVGPGTPYFEDALESFRSALSKVDFESPETSDWKLALETVLRESRPRDTLTLWHLLYRVQGANREMVYERTAALIPPPEGVTRAGILQLDEKMLHLWKGHIENNWSNDSGLKKAWIDHCLEVGASDYISKPLDIDQLLSLLRVWLYRQDETT